MSFVPAQPFLIHYAASLPPTDDDWAPGPARPLLPAGELHIWRARLLGATASSCPVARENARRLEAQMLPPRHYGPLCRRGELARAWRIPRQPCRACAFPGRNATASPCWPFRGPCARWGWMSSGCARTSPSMKWPRVSWICAPSGTCASPGPGRKRHGNFSSFGRAMRRVPKCAPFPRRPKPALSSFANSRPNQDFVAALAVNGGPAPGAAVLGLA